ncbi:MAG: hypothetical protein EU532_11275 [Promethearchaeota archaeon]|nr:MAG: hypothetical protein EU532_11275 [Candidatus Lokiarchaeota archaeon]
MNNSLHSTQNSKISLELIRTVVKEIEKILSNDNIFEQQNFKRWQDDFKIIYGSQFSDLKLYLTLSLIYFIGQVLISKFVFGEGDLNLNHKNFVSTFQRIKTKVNKEYTNFKLFDFRYFDPIYESIKLNKLPPYAKLLNKIVNILSNLGINPEYILDYFVQEMIPHEIRHKTGEFFTPNFIVKSMINTSYQVGEKVVDPCCGSGNFLIAILKKILASNTTDELKILAINNIYGYDINPISIYMTKINFLLILKEHLSIGKVNLYVLDSLFPSHNKNKKKAYIENSYNTFDLVIGNPPWYTLRDIDSIENQTQIKNLAENLGIKPLPKNILNIEISALFFYQARELYLKSKGKIFFVITKGVMTGSHASRFRNFQGFKKVKICLLEQKLEKIFNIDFICLFAQKSEFKTELTNREIKVDYLKLSNQSNSVDYFDDLELVIEKSDIFLPYHIEKKGNKVYTKKYISKELLKELLPYGVSIYKKLFHKGADLNPRNLIFVKCKKLDDSLVEINPDDRIFKNAKSPWNKREFKNELIEKKYIFNVIKSTELLKFYIYDSYHVFLPLSKRDLKFNYNELTDKAKRFYDIINQKYITYKKRSTKHKSLLDNLNRWEKLINKRQLAKIKVVYNNSGSVLNSVVVIGDFLVTGDLSFYDTENLEEAYYLSSILNSNLMTKQIKIRKSSRHIFKIPFEIPIKKFNSNNQNHIQLAHLGKECHRIVKKKVMEMVNNENQDFSKIKFQKALILRLKLPLEQIDEILKLEFE